MFYTKQASKRTKPAGGLRQDMLAGNSKTTKDEELRTFKYSWKKRPSIRELRSANRKCNARGTDAEKT